MKKLRLQGYVHSLFFKITAVYVVGLLIMGLWGCYVSYSKEQNEIVHRFERTMNQIDNQYTHATEDFWRIYMPIFEYPGSLYSSLRNYLRLDAGDALNPIAKSELTRALRAIMANDERIRWVGLYAGRNQTGWLLFSGNGTLTEMPDDFPFREDLDRKGAAKEIFESRVVEIQGIRMRSYVQCGGVTLDIPGGCLLVGYDADELAPQTLEDPQLANVRFLLLQDKSIIYDSANLYEFPGNLSEELTGMNTGFHIINGEVFFLQKYETGVEAHTILCMTSWRDMFLKSLSSTPIIVLIVAVFWCISLMIYSWTRRTIQRKIEKIQYGLEKIGNNQLDYRISVPCAPKDEFDSIGASINDVAIQLQENILKAYRSMQKQREAELSELQTRFDPHFLYNSLEVIRGRVCENGDDETADIIVKLAQIFRSFIGSELFVSIQEELDFCNLYLSLLRYRYDDKVNIIYDVDSDILQMGIMRNLLQPILENYFIHGFRTKEEDNWLSIHGFLQDQDYVSFQIKDNGVGISTKRLEEIQNRLNEEKSTSESCYGLYNIHQRIKLFYGSDCGLSISLNKYGGTTISIRILRLSCEEHKTRLGRIEEADQMQHFYDRAE